jgi:hypothetical protein
VAGIALSPFSGDIPHFPKYETAQGIEGNEWVNTYAENSLSIVAPYSEVPIDRVSATRGEPEISELSQSQTYVYSDLSNRSGVISSDGRSIGGRNFLFIKEPSSQQDNIVYVNGQQSVYIHN